MSETLRLVQLNGRRDQGEWQFQTLDGTPAGVGLFISREWALRWAREQRVRVVEESQPALEPALFATESSPRRHP